MRFSLLSTVFLLLVPDVSIAHPQPLSQLSRRDALGAILDQPASEAHNLWKRKGGGGGGGKGSTSSSSSSSSSSSAGKTSGSTSSSSSGSIAGGSTKAGSGATRSYGGGNYYGGGATVPYTSGSKSPLGLIALPLVGVALLVYPGIWLYGAYAYNYNHPYSFYNRTARRNLTSTATPTKRSLVERFLEIERRQDSTLGLNETKPITCLCAMEAVCGCDDNGNTSFLDSIIGDGDYSKLNLTLVQVADINNVSTIILNGTLPSGTTAPGGTDSSAMSLGAGRSLTGYGVMMVIIGFTYFFL